ncbi:Elongation factor 4 [Frankliniella fusca]|uniref:Elongation factor 4 n=1 Tax=Frankliniella fusca TaxID=407009 RepID=A0AAE1L8Y4_9NEOP|nr:Elongation factor 4 [Frankliniella fusca]
MSVLYILKSKFTPKIYACLFPWFPETKELDGEDVIKEYCPISGRFDFTYNVNDGLENKQECPNSVSELNNCPNGNALNVRFKSCSFENHSEYTTLQLLSN